MEKKVFMNGELVPETEAKISVFDHGYLYGDGVFEGIRSYQGRVFKLKEHVKRLYESAHSIMLHMPYTREEMEEAILDTIRANNLEDAYVRVIISRGVGDLGLDPKKCSKSTVIIIANEITLFPEEVYEKGLSVVTVPTRRNIPDAVDPQVKSLNYLNNILVKIEANQAGVMEAVMLNKDGYVTEGSGENIFIYRDGRLLTPPPYVGILQGIKRNTVMELARKEGITVEEMPFTRHQLYVAEECFLTGTAAEVIPVIQIDGRNIGAGVPGEVTRNLITRFREYATSNGVEIYNRK